MTDEQNPQTTPPDEEQAPAPEESPQSDSESSESESSQKPKKRGRKAGKKKPIDLSKVVSSAKRGESEQDDDDQPAASDDATGDGPDAEQAADEESGPAVAAEPVQEPATDEVDDKPDDETESGKAAPEVAPAELALRAAVEAIIFASDDPVTPATIAKAIGDVKPSAVRKAILGMKEAREAAGSGISVVEVAGGWTMLTHEEHAPAIRRLRKAAESRKLTAAALETLSVVAYKQPIQKQEIEDIRGVSCGPILRTLMERQLVKIAGRAEALGRPLLYATTKQFLDAFGMASLKDLPKISELSSS